MAYQVTLCAYHMKPSEKVSGTRRQSLRPCICRHEIVFDRRQKTRTGFRMLTQRCDSRASCSTFYLPFLSSPCLPYTSQTSPTLPPSQCSPAVAILRSQSTAATACCANHRRPIRLWLNPFLSYCMCASREVKIERDECHGERTAARDH